MYVCIYLNTARSAPSTKTVKNYPDGDLTLINVTSAYDSGQWVVSDTYNTHNIIYKRDYEQGVYVYLCNYGPDTHTMHPMRICMYLCICVCLYIYIYIYKYIYIYIYVSIILK